MMNLQNYVVSVSKKYNSGQSTEHSFRGDLENLLKALLPQKFTIINEPKRRDCGAPDYIIEQGSVPIGFIEAKDIGDTDLEGKSKNKEQFTRYKKSLANIAFTDYLNFYFYRDAELIEQIEVAQLVDGQIKPLPENFDKFIHFSGQFFQLTGQPLKSSEALAKIMAGKAKLLADIIFNALESDEKSSANSSLHSQFKAFQKTLIHDSTTQSFADVYAQTITYGLFAARLYDESLETFTKEEAARLIPKSNPFLKKLFSYILSVEFDDRIAWVVDDLVQVFKSANVKNLLSNYGKTTKMDDPIIHFYETFLAEYDPKLRKSRGVWYTPKPVVDFIVRSVDEVLKVEFGLKAGLADTSKVKVKLKTTKQDGRTQDGVATEERSYHKVQILDPATGTGTFLAATIKFIHNKLKNQQGIWNTYVDKDLLPRVHGFEILMASYAMAHLQIGLLLKETGNDNEGLERLSVYLTNSLEEYHPDTGTLFASWLSNEAEEANRIKKDTPVMCIMGNPPYSGESANKGDWIMGLMEDYKKEPEGKIKLQERNPKWINDDYVKFIRYGQHYIEKNGTGVLAFINPHGFLDNPTFRGMRWNLLKTFDKIYTIDLHGNAKKKEAAPDGSKDENVFDIMQGVSINIFIKTGNKKENELGQFFHHDLYGCRKDKYQFLDAHSINSIPYQQLPNQAPMYFMVPKDFELEGKYNKGVSLTDLFPLNNVGIVTARDSFSIQMSKQSVNTTIERFLSLGDEEARQEFSLGKDVRDWKVSYARRDLTDNYPKVGVFTEVNYRPFDRRWTFYTGNSKGFHCYPRKEVMQHFIKRGNLGLVFKLGHPETASAPIMVADSIIDFRSWSRPGMQGGDYIAPLYQYSDEEQTDVFQTTKRTPNFNKEHIEQFAQGIGLTFTLEKENTPNTFSPVDVLDYIYAVLHSPSYREIYKEFLKIDFPKVPYPADKDKFWQLVALGKQIRELHLLESATVEDYITSYPVDGSNTVDKPEYKGGKVWINAEQYFDGVPPVAWEFYIGGYQPAQKWLKDRKGMILEFDDILHYQKMIVALTETDRLMKEIDEIGVL